MGTYATRAKDVDRRWFLVDAEGQTVGRMASEIACLLRGKWNPLYVPYLDTGDHVIVINAERAVFTGRKLQQKTYFRHTGWLGHGRFERLVDRMKKEPDEVVRDAVWGMLPKGPLGRQMIRKLNIYRGPTHPHEAQQAVPYTLGGQGRSMPVRPVKAEAATPPAKRAKASPSASSTAAPKASAKASPKASAKAPAKASAKAPAKTSSKE
jgi:large subunit ribosomal protein L13